ncbi:aminoglycoside 6'-N-acetyltransferase [Clostridium hydrogeniformans]|uniref:aminoglycoside 6'-N-acetyltransferase n=1 Tax=Clostridium hydrogeniformans TaxID=349933 RepID=UPI000ACB32FB|nr:aminoglycoside 6'-N-acetyltransferase [Clostridium hydrogeniformans]
MKNEILTSNIENLDHIVDMALQLWPDNTEEGLKEEFIEKLKSEKDQIFLYRIENEFAGFIHVAIRTDYVEGAGSSPTGFIEGIFVKEEFRDKGIARDLVKKGELWAKSKGCREIGSDVEFHNKESYNFHKKIGYTEVNRIICFLKTIK